MKVWHLLFMIVILIICEANFFFMGYQVGLNR